jgi:hypothetical protein
MDRVYSYRPSKLLIGYVFLALWTVYGFVSMLDNTTQWGCIVTDSLYSTANIAYSLVSVSMILVSFYFRKTSTGNWILLLEAAIWLYKLFFIKGGYVAGYGGGVSEGVLIFDFIALFLRLMILKLLLRQQAHWILVLIFTILLLFLKVTYFR